MAKTLFFRNTQTGKEYRVTTYDKATGAMELIGPNGVTFRETYDAERFQRLGYVLEKREVEA